MQGTKIRSQITDSEDSQSHRLTTRLRFIVYSYSHLTFTTLSRMSSMTSPSPSPPHQQANMSRRPPRKSTLTQQQKNQKRQRATQEQLVTLEAEFNKNPTPTALVRERIAQEINMTERSVQIWFQNRYVAFCVVLDKMI